MSLAEKIMDSLSISGRVFLVEPLDVCHRCVLSFPRLWLPSTASTLSRPAWRLFTLRWAARWIMGALHPALTPLVLPVGAVVFAASLWEGCAKERDKRMRSRH